MASPERSKASSEGQNWETTIRTLHKIMNTQHSELGKLVKDRKVLVDHVKKIKDRWAEEVRLLEDELAQVFLGLKETEAFLAGIKLECIDSEIEGFKGLYCNKFFGSKEGGKGGDKSKASSSKPSENPKEDKQRQKVLEDEIKRLKQQYDQLAKKKDSEVSALLASIDQLQSSMKEKDNEIANSSKVATVEADSNNFKEEISRLSRDLARKSTSASSTPALNQFTSGTRTNSLRGNKGAEKESSVAQLPEPLKDTKKGSKRNGDDGIISSKRKKGDTAPKLEIRSTGVRKRPSGRYRAEIGGGKNRKNLGTFDTIEDAARAYAEEARQRGYKLK